VRAKTRYLLAGLGRQVALSAKRSVLAVQECVLASQLKSLTGA
jgi:hypothetical protein